jgi:hypothetical protein
MDCCATGLKQRDGESKPIRYCIEIGTIRSVDIHKVIQSDFKTKEVRSTIPMFVRMSRACVSSAGPQDFEPAVRAGFSQLHIDTIEIDL